MPLYDYNEPISTNKTKCIKLLNRQYHAEKLRHPEQTTAMLTTEVAYKVLFT